MRSACVIPALLPAAAARAGPPTSDHRRGAAPDTVRPRRRALAAAEAEEAALDAAEQAGGQGPRPAVADAAGPGARGRRRAAGAVVADPRASPSRCRRRDGRRGTDLSFVGVYVRALLPGGAAEQSGAVAPGDQLVAIDGDAVFDARSTRRWRARRRRRGGAARVLPRRPELLLAAVGWRAAAGAAMRWTTAAAARVWWRRARI